MNAGVVIALSVFGFFVLISVIAAVVVVASVSATENRVDE